MKMTKKIMAMAACAVMTVTSMVGMGASASQINGGQITYTNVPLIIQTTDNNCSATTLLEMAYGLGLESKISGDTDAKKIDWIWSNLAEYDEDGKKSVFVYKFSNFFNQYLTYYKYEHKTKYELNDSSDLEGKIHMSLWHNRPVAIRSDPKKIGYYGNYQSNNLHYIAISQSDALNHSFTVVDCNNNPKYGGYHYNVPLTDIYNSTTYVIYGN